MPILIVTDQSEHLTENINTNDAVDYEAVMSTDETSKDTKVSMDVDNVETTITCSSSKSKSSRNTTISNVRKARMTKKKGRKVKTHTPIVSDDEWDYMIDEDKPFKTTGRKILYPLRPGEDNRPVVIHNLYKRKNMTAMMLVGWTDGRRDWSQMNEAAKDNHVIVEKYLRDNKIDLVKVGYVKPPLSR